MLTFVPATWLLRAWLLAAGPLALVHCGAKEDATLFVYTRDPSVTKGTNAFGPKIDARVTVVFDMGHYSAGAVTVESIKLGMFRGDTQILDILRFVPNAGQSSPPMNIAPGTVTELGYSVSAMSLNDEQAKILCAGPVSISGTVQQAGGGAPSRIGATSVSPQGCP